VQRHARDDLRLRPAGMCQPSRCLSTSCIETSRRKCGHDQPAQSRPLLRWRVFVAEAGDARYQALPRALAGAAAFQTAVSKLVYDVLMIKARIGSMHFSLHPHEGIMRCCHRVIGCEPL